MERLDTSNCVETSSGIGTYNTNTLFHRSKHCFLQKTQLLLNLAPSNKPDPDSPAREYSASNLLYNHPPRRSPRLPSTKAISRHSLLVGASIFDLSYSRFNIDQLPNSIQSHTETLHTLDLSHNRFIQVPRVLLLLTNLTTLKLDHNYIRSLPSDIANLTRLEILSLANNSISSLPPSVGQLYKTMTVLDLEQNHLEQIPVELQQLRQLKVLRLSCNRLKSLPAIFDGWMEPRGDHSGLA